MVLKIGLFAKVVAPYKANDDNITAKKLQTMIDN